MFVGLLGRISCWVTGGLTCWCLQARNHQPGTTGVRASQGAQPSSIWSSRLCRPPRRISDINRQKYLSCVGSAAAALAPGSHQSFNQWKHPVECNRLLCLTSLIPNRLSSDHCKNLGFSYFFSDNDARMHTKFSKIR